MRRFFFLQLETKQFFLQESKAKVVFLTLFGHQELELKWYWLKVVVSLKVWVLFEEMVLWRV